MYVSTKLTLSICVDRADKNNRKGQALDVNFCHLLLPFLDASSHFTKSGRIRIKLPQFPLQIVRHEGTSFPGLIRLPALAPLSLSLVLTCSSQLRF